MSDYASRAMRAGIDRASNKPTRASRSSERALAVTATLVIAAAVVLFAPSILRVTRYEISGNASMTREDVLSSALIHEKEYFFSLDAARVKAALEADPRVASASVSKRFPNAFRIAVKERAAVAAVLVAIDGRSSAVFIDAEGVAFAEAGQEEAASVPVLSGLRFEGFRLGARLPPALTVLVASLGDILASEPALLAAISEIRVVKPSSAAPSGGEAPELLIYPLNQRIPVRANASLDAPTLRSIILVLDVLGTRGIAASVQEIDFRTGTVVYRSKEGQSG